MWSRLPGTDQTRIRLRNFKRLCDFRYLDCLQLWLYLLNVEVFCKPLRQTAWVPPCNRHSTIALSFSPYLLGLGVFVARMPLQRSECHIFLRGNWSTF